VLVDPAARMSVFLQCIKKLFALHEKIFVHAPGRDRRAEAAATDAAHNPLFER
jgi:hypothetical protein